MSIVLSETIVRSVSPDNRYDVDFRFVFHTTEEISLTSFTLFQGYATAPPIPDGSVYHIYAEDVGDVLWWNGTAWVNFRIVVLEPAQLIEIAEREFVKFLEQLKQGVDIFNLTPNHQTATTLFTRVIDTVVQLEIMDLIEWVAGINHITTLNKPTIESYGQNWTDINTWSGPADTFKVAYDNYTPIPGSEAQAFSRGNSTQ